MRKRETNPQIYKDRLTRSSKHDRQRHDRQADRGRGRGKRVNDNSRTHKRQFRDKQTIISKEINDS